MPLRFVIICWDTRHSRVEQCFNMWFRKTKTVRHTVAQVKEVRPRTGHKGPPRGEVQVQLYSFFKLRARWGWWSMPLFRRFTPVKWSGIHFTEGWVDSRPGLDGIRPLGPSSTWRVAILIGLNWPTRFTEVCIYINILPVSFEYSPCWLQNGS